jgi:hypothetical protein
MHNKMSPKMKMFEKSSTGKEKGAKEGSKKDMSADKRQMPKMVVIVAKPMKKK